MPAQNNPVHFLLALQCEAKPLIDYYELKRCMDETVFAIFRNQDITLTISGIGKAAMAAATAYTYARYGMQHSSAVWINIGIAGHPSLAIGSCRLANTITDQASGRRWYPGFSASPALADSPLLSVDQPETQYSNNCMYDMEASAFIATAARFSTLNLIHSLKVISDNPTTPATAINAKLCTQLIGQQITAIDGLKHALLALQDQLPDTHPEALSRYLEHWHFTAHQQSQLAGLLSRWQLLCSQPPPDPSTLTQHKHSKQLIAWLNAKIANMPRLFP